MTKTRKMRELLASPGLLLLPGVGDALGALIVEEAGFHALTISGHIVAATYGMPDLGLLTMTEMVERAAIIAQAVTIPVRADADTGYGNAINVYRTVQEFERAGVAAIHLEDQVSPKRCGQLTGKSVISLEEMLGKIHAAIDARRDPDLVIFARTDSMHTHGIEEVIRRGKAFEKAGADVIQVIMHRGPRMLDDLRVLCSAFDKPLSIDLSEAGTRPIAPFPDLASTRLKVASLPLTLGLFTATTAMRQAAREIRKFGLEGLRSVMGRNDSWDSVENLIGLKRVNDLSMRYGVQAIAEQIKE
jgi:2-methylisocitrate lyase-like PEP mutase family enzyme